MTDLIVETEDGNVLFFYIHDGKDRIIYISPKRGWIERRYKVPKEYKRALALLSKLAEQASGEKDTRTIPPSKKEHRETRQHQ